MADSYMNPLTSSCSTLQQILREIEQEIYQKESDYQFKSQVPDKNCSFFAHNADIGKEPKQSFFAPMQRERCKSFCSYNSKRFKCLQYI